LVDFCVAFFVLIVPSCARWKSRVLVTSYPREFA
jgi:hypothetical protein